MNYAPRPRRRGTLALLPALCAVFLAACDSGTEPLRPHAIEIVAGDAQTATAGAAVAVPPTVRVVTAKGRGVPGVEINFSVAAGGGAVMGSGQKTDAEGIARATSWLLGATAGENAVTVTSPELPSASARFRATAAPGEAAGLAIVTQPAGVVMNGTTLGTQPAVRLVDRFGNAVARAGVTVTAATADARLTLSNATAVTSDQGIATFGGVTLRGTVGSYSIEFRAAGLASVLASAVTLTAGPAHHLGMGTQPPASVFRTQKLTPGPVVEIRDEAENVVPGATSAVTVELSGPGTLAGARSIVAAAGRAAFADLAVSDTGVHRLRFSAAGLGEAVSTDFMVRDLAESGCASAGARAVTLNFTLGQTLRRTASAADAPACLEFDLARNANQQYLVLFENLPLLGDYDGGLYPGTSGGEAASIGVELQPAFFGGALPRLARVVARAPAPEPVADWDFGAGRIYEGQVQQPAAAALEPKLLRGGRLYSLASAHPQVGDTVQVQLNGISRLNIPTAPQRVVVRHISDELIFAEDTRLGTLTRDGSTPTAPLLNTPLTMETMDSIARAYAAIARVQGNLLFEGGYNNSINAYGTPQKVLAVHTLMYANNIWGYTYPTGHYFAYDYWVGTNGSTRDLNQSAQRVADNLFMHEIAHMRHVGLFERAGVPISLRGNQWVVEGFARFTERLTVANRLLGTVSPSRLDNLVLPLNPAFNNRYYFEDVPAYLQAGSSMFGGYGASAYVFDYFLDQVAASGRDPLPALRELLLAAGRESTLDAAVARWLPGLTFAELFTRARIALYADDYGVAGLPQWTQYLQFQLRASRPPGTQIGNDPRSRWPKLKPGEFAVASDTVTAGGAYGYLVDGTVATGSAKILLTAPAPQTVISITRIR